MKTDKFVISPGATLKLQQAIRRNNAGMRELEWLSCTSNMCLIRRIASGSCKLVEVSAEELTIRVDRSPQITSRAPGLSSVGLFPALERSGPPQFLVTELELNFFNRDEEEISDGPKLLAEIQNTPIHWRTLSIHDLCALQKRGTDFCKRHFWELPVYAWKSITIEARFNGNLFVPCLDSDLQIQWHNLALTSFNNAWSPALPSRYFETFVFG